MEYRFIDTGIKTHKSIEILDIDNTIQEAKEVMKKDGVDIDVHTFMKLASQNTDKLLTLIDMYEVGYMIGYMNAKHELD